jgi:integrating conjugative element relaxase (TIGR03760 family)
MGLLKRLRPSAALQEAAAAPSPALVSDRLPVLVPGELLQGHAQTLSQIRRQVGVPLAHWDALYQPLLDRFAAFVQQLPASEAHHHRQPGGLLQHGLDTALKALTLRRGILLPPGSSAERLAEKQDVWTYATTSAALLHDLGKPVVDQQVDLLDPNGRNLGRWNPLAGPIRPPATHYSIRYVRGRRYRLHPRLPPMLVHHLVPAVALEWLVQDLDVFEAWLAVISGGDSELAGPLGQIIQQADGLSVAADLGAEPSSSAAAGARRPLAERLSLALRRLIDDQALPLNRPGAAGFVIGDDLWLVSKRTLDALREALSADTPTGVPSRNERLMDELQQHGVLMPCQDRAIWMATVELGEWRQPLSLLRIPLPRLWTDPAARPAAAAGRIVLEAPDQPPPAEAAASQSPVTSTPRPVAAEDTLPLPPLAAETEIERGPASRPSRAEQTPGTASDGPVAPPGPVLAPAVVRAADKPASPLADNDLIQWIIQGLTQGRLKINTVDARLHVTQEGLLLVSPGIFRDFAGMDGWLAAQKRLVKHKAHLRTPDRTNIWTYRVIGERKSSALLKGILIPDPAAQLGLQLPEPNPHLALVPPAAAPVAEASP